MIELPESLLARYLELSGRGSRSPWVSSVEGRDHMSGDSVILRGRAPRGDLALRVSEDGVSRRGVAELDVVAAARNYVPELIYLLTGEPIQGSGLLSEVLVGLQGPQRRAMLEELLAVSRRAAAGPWELVGSSSAQYGGFGVRGLIRFEDDLGPALSTDVELAVSGRNLVDRLALALLDSW